MNLPIACVFYQLSQSLISQDGAGSPKDVFLYTKAHLRQQVALPEPETVVLPRIDGEPSQSEFCNFVELSRNCSKIVKACGHQAENYCYEISD